MKPVHFVFAYISALLFTVTAHASDTLSIEGFLHAKNIKAEKTREGAFYVVNTEGKGANPKQGDYVKLKYAGKLMDGKLFDESPKGEPFVFQVGYRQVIQGWDVLMPKLKVGTKATLYIPAELGYGNTGIGDIIPPNASLIFDVEVEEVMSIDAYDNYMRQLEDKERIHFKKKMEDQFLQDKKLIQEHIVAHKLKAERTPKGMSYVITKKGKGAMPKEGSKITVNYEGTLLNDTIFDTTEDKSPFTFTMGEGKVIEGWEDGLKFFNKGSQGYLLIPSKMGYGATPLEEENKTLIPAHSVLVFKIEVVDIQ
jgi:FKBP-type peptidyl-prolyl cis-trans isomerase